IGPSELGIGSTCARTSPLRAQYASAFPTGINAAATWDVGARGKPMSPEFRGKGVNVALGPMTYMGASAPLLGVTGRASVLFLSGVATVATINGIQSNGVIATVKH
ncbi:hypothetical protein B0H13DRAFT_1502159, partial [Mycena leptocephala]